MDGRPLVYVTFGSAAPSMDFFPGLYRAAIDALAGLPVRLLVTIGRDRDPAELGLVPANVRVERWVAQADLMPHVAAMVCHGGSGTVTMGLAAGVPMAVVPLFADQPWNASASTRWGEAVALARGAEAATHSARRSSGSSATRRIPPAPSGSPPKCTLCPRSSRGRRRPRAARRSARRVTS